MDRAEIGFLLTDEGSRWVDASPSTLRVGAIQLAGWQIAPVRPVPEVFGHTDAYLIKVNFDLDTEPGGPPPRWFEIGFRLATDIGTPSVLDALPGPHLGPNPATAYHVNAHLNFVPAGAERDDAVHLSVGASSITTFGIGGNEIRWRHFAEQGDSVRCGSYAHWAVLLLPPGAETLRVTAHARFDLALEDTLGYLPATQPASFALDLTGHEPPVTVPPMPPSAVDAPAPLAAPRAPRVFVSYAHDDEIHVDKVRLFAEFLLTCGIDVHMDRWDLNMRRDWYLWAMDQVDQADFVIMVASPICKAVGEGRVANDKNRGMQSEIALIRERLHSDRATWRRKLLPVVLPGRSADELPAFVQPQTADHYPVTGFTIDGAADLLRTITGRPTYVRPAIAPQVVHLPPRE
ncbi:SEFIR domain-containing protein [Micromonospora sp. NPDC006766]|uniref:SEFIR domain-containing protein n=1 Tax=Micromonospora sp. NPDC006766 TaxID=3154778 RepID=UPI003400802E